MQIFGDMSFSNYTRTVNIQENNQTNEEVWLVTAKIEGGQDTQVSRVSCLPSTLAATTRFLTPTPLLSLFSCIFTLYLAA